FLYSFSNNNNDWIILKNNHTKRYTQKRIIGKRYLIPKNDFKINGLIDNEIGVISSGDIFLSADNEITKYILNQFNKFDQDIRYNKILKTIFLNLVLGQYLDTERLNIKNDTSRFDTYLNRHFESSIRVDSLWEFIDKKELIHLITETDFEL